jgi:ribosome-associated toxin RatA of RatAB toxin-antitoxin module
MPEFSRSTTIEASPDELFEFLSRVENLPQYFTGLTEAHHTSGDEVHVSADPAVTGGHPDATGAVQAEAWFRIDAERRALAWGAEGPHDYRGELQVTPDGDNARVSLHLHTEHDAAESIERGIATTLANIEHLVARGGAAGG